MATNDTEKRLREVENAAVRTDEHNKNMYKWMEQHQESEKQWQDKHDDKLDLISKRLMDNEKIQNDKNHELNVSMEKVDTKRILSLEDLSSKIDTVIDGLEEANKVQKQLVALKNKWGGVILALSFVGAAMITLSTTALTWFKALFT